MEGAYKSPLCPNKYKTELTEKSKTLSRSVQRSEVTRQTTIPNIGETNRLIENQTTKAETHQQKISVGTSSGVENLTCN